MKPTMHICTIFLVILALCFFFFIPLAYEVVLTNMLANNYLLTHAADTLQHEHPDQCKSFIHYLLLNQTLVYFGCLPFHVGQLA